MAGFLSKYFLPGYRIAFVLPSLIFAGCSTSEWIEVRCPDQNYATRLPRDANSAYRHYGTMYETGYKASESALRELLPRISHGDTTRILIEEFTHYLVGERTAVEHQTNEVVEQLQSDPCDEKARKKFQFLVEYINFNGRYLHKIAAACKDTSSELRTMLVEYRAERE